MAANSMMVAMTGVAELAASAIRACNSAGEGTSTSFLRMLGTVASLATFCGT